MDSVNNLELKSNQSSTELTLSVTLGSNIKVSLLDDIVLLVKGESIDLRLDVSKSDILGMIDREKKTRGQ